jgi:hypothetical protein
MRGRPLVTPVTDTICPAWCDPEHCSTTATGTVRHSCAPLTWHPDEDSELTVRRIWLDEAASEVEFELTVADLAFGDRTVITLDEAHASMLCAAFAHLRSQTDG